MIDLVILKQIHIMLAFSTVVFFVIRFSLNEFNKNIIRHRFFKTAPHVVDTFLLITGIMLAWAYKVTPLDAMWFLVKIILIMFYIICGFIAMKSMSRKKRFSSAILGFLLFITAIYLAQQKPFW